MVEQGEPSKTAAEPAQHVDDLDEEKHTQFETEVQAVSAIELEYTKEEEQKMVRKLDWHILGFVNVLYLLSYLDRGNIGNANTAGLSKSLGMSDPQYQWLLTIFYITYICFQFLTYCWKMFPPRYYVTFVVFGWGVIATAQAATHNWAGMMVLRCLLGIFEAGFGPGVPYYLTFFYYRHELAFRTGLFIAMSSLASAFAGALAYGITYHKLAIDSWRVLFIVEGLPTVVVAFFALIALPSNVTECRFLTERQKQIGCARTAKQTGTVDRGGHKVSFKEAAVGFIDPINIIPALMFFSINVSFSSLPVFLPTILDAMGYESVDAQGLSAPPYIVTTILVVAACWYSDRIMQRGLVIIVIASFGAAGFLILALCHNTGAKYFAVYLASAGVFPCVPLLLSWVGNNQGSDTKRGTGYVLLQLIGQCGPLLGTRLYPKTDSPYYRKGFFVCFGFMVLVAVLGLVLRFYLQYKNKQLDEQYGVVETDPDDPVDNLGIEGEGNPNFRYIL